jgi:hypothetical protein
MLAVGCDGDQAVAVVASAAVMLVACTPAMAEA